MPQLHPFCQQRPIVAYCQEHGILVQAHTPLVRGRLDHPVFKRITEKVSTLERHARRRSRLMSSPALFPQHSADGRFLDPAQVLLRWSLQHG